MAAAVADVQAIVDVSQSAMDALRSMISLYDEQLDRVIAWKTFEDTMDKMSKYRDNFSQAAGDILGQVKTLLLNSKDQYQISVRAVYEWCQLAMMLLPGYKEVLDQQDREGMAAQKELLLAVLEDGISKMTTAIKALDESSSSFNDCAGQLVKLNIQLTNDFQQGSAYHSAAVERIRKEAYGSAAAGVVGGPFGLIISYSIAAGVVEGQLIPQLNARFDEVKAAFNNAEDLVKKANTDIEDAKLKLTAETQTVSDLRAKTLGFETYLKLTTPLISMLKKRADDLMDACNSYIDRHGGSHL